MSFVVGPFFNAGGRGVSEVGGLGGRRREGEYRFSRRAFVFSTVFEAMEGGYLIMGRPWMGIVGGIWWSWWWWWW